MEKNPDYTTFCKFRNKLGLDEIEKIFNATRQQLKEKGYLTEVLTFIDATALVSKLSMWEEKDQSIKDGYEKFNNEIIDKYAKDKEVRIGAKSKNKFWFGFKKHVSVDTQSGMINKVKVTKVNVPDADGLEFVCQDQGAVLARKSILRHIFPSIMFHEFDVTRNGIKKLHKALFKPIKLHFSNTRILLWKYLSQNQFPWRFWGIKVMFLPLALSKKKVVIQW